MGIAAITLAGQIIGIIGPLAIDEVMKIKNNMTLGPDVQVNITNLGATATQADQDAMDQINQWRTSQGLPPLS